MDSMAKSARFSVAPMMDWTDRHCRRFHRLLTREALLYTEMVTTGAILHGDAARFLAFDPEERPLALQLGGSDPKDLAAATRIAAAYGYDAINLNCGCPSDRVQNGAFGACLMREPALVADCLAAMRDRSPLPVTVKCRLGVDDQEERDSLFAFVETLARAGTGTFVVHARKAWLKGLSPKENRDIPPLNYPLVKELKAAFPELTVVLNGGLADLDRAEAALAWADGVMLGRAAYQEPWLLSQVDSRLFGQAPPVSERAELVERLTDLGAETLARGWPLKALARHSLGLMNGLPGARHWRRTLSEGMRDPAAGPALFHEAFAQVRTPALRVAA